MLKKERYRYIIDWFKENMPNPETELHYHNPYELLVAVILSAQCTDKRVNMVPPELFKEFPTPEKLAEAPVEEIFEYIISISYPNNQSKHLSAMANMLVNDFNSNVLEDRDLLQKLH